MWFSASVSVGAQVRDSPRREDVAIYLHNASDNDLSGLAYSLVLVLLHHLKWYVAVTYPLCFLHYSDWRLLSGLCLVSCLPFPTSQGA